MLLKTADRETETDARRGEEKAALIVAHPGHELCVYGWMKLNRPVVYALTDGSTASRPARLSMTAGVLAGVGAAPGGFFGVTNDPEIYAALLDVDVQFFADLAHQLSKVLLAEGITLLAGDAAEGYSPTHDICRAVASAAVALANRSRTEAPISDYEFTVIGRQDSSAQSVAGAIVIKLDDVTFDQKIKAMRFSPELADEVRAGLELVELSSLKSLSTFAAEAAEIVRLIGGAEGFRTECLRPASGRPLNGPPHGPPPFYERYAAALVNAGKYARAIGYRDHYLPIAEQLRELAVTARPMSP